MGTNKPGEWPTNTEPTWTDESLPLAVRHGLLDRVLDRLKAQKGLGPSHPGNQDRPEHPGESGSESSGHNI